MVAAPCDWGNSSIALTLFDTLESTQDVPQVSAEQVDRQVQRFVVGALRYV